MRFCRSVAASTQDRDTITCDPREAIAIHDADLSSAGADEVAAIARALFIAMVNASRHPPDAAQRQEAEQAEVTDHDRIE